MSLLNSVKNLFRPSKTFIETRYLKKYKGVEDRETILQLLREYKSGDIIFEPIRNKLTEAEQEKLYEQIDKSDILSSQEKAKAIIGLMMILDGSFPKRSIVSYLEKVFGEELIKIIEKKRNEFKSEIAVKKLIGLLK